ncbi:MAG: dihydrolipoyl dehydrogenase [Acidobacteria bacterium]|nr:dihydrolipoyl dehydrogenase [Acidobacteriota bacterium]
MVVGSVSKGCQVAVIGAGPGGYVAAIRLAQLGKDVILIEKAPRLGGVCLNEGCIPSKALIHAAELKHEIEHGRSMGLGVDDVSVDLARMVSWKDGIVRRLTSGVQFLCEKNGAEILHGTATFTSDRSLRVDTGEGQAEIEFEQAVIATGSSPMDLPGFERDGEKVITAREALSLDRVPERLVVIGAGYIGLELGTAYAKLGAKVSVIEFLPEVFPGLDPEVAPILRRRLKQLGITLYLNHRAHSVTPGDPSIVTAIGPDEATLELEADRVLVSVGRVANTVGLGLDTIGVQLDGKGFVVVNEQQETDVPGIYAIGDVAGGILLAHKAYREAKVAAEVIAGESAAFDNVAVPAVVYTDPEIAWSGLGEREAHEQGRNVVTGTFPLRASGRAMTLNATEGFLKVIADADSGQLLGVLAVGRGVSELMGEATFGLEMGAFLEDLAATIHPHPTMSEALHEAVELALGKGVHVLNS